MNNDINFLTGIQDPGLQLDKGGTEAVDDKIKVIDWQVPLSHLWSTDAKERFPPSSGSCHRPVGRWHEDRSHD